MLFVKVFEVDFFITDVFLIFMQKRKRPKTDILISWPDMLMANDPLIKKFSALSESLICTSFRVFLKKKLLQKQTNRE